MTDCQPDRRCEHRDFLIQVLINNEVDFLEKWRGWKMRGVTLISPDGRRISNPQLRVLFWKYGTTIRPRRNKCAVPAQGELF